MPIAEFFKELQSRSVIRAAVAHIVVFWVLAQVADVVLPYIGVDDNPVRWAVIAGVALFPLTIIVAWIVEHPWRRYTRGRVATDLFIIAAVAVVSAAWAVRNVPQVVHTKTSIVILPFQHSGEPLESSVSKALAYEINSLLMRSRSIDVIGYESAVSPVLTDLSANAVSARLGVEHVLSGELSVDDALLRISLRLLNAAGEQLWETVIDGKLEDLFAIQEDIASSIQSRLGAGEKAVPVATAAAARCPMPPDPQALEDYYTARYWVELRTDSDISRRQLRDAVALYENLIDVYPDFADALSGLAWALMHQGVYDPDNALPMPDRSARATALAERALAACPTSGDAMHILPNPHDHENRWIGQHRQLTAFIEQQPWRTELYQRLARHYRETGLKGRAREVAENNYRSNPLSPKAIRVLASILQAPETIEEAIELFDLAAELGSTGPNFARMMRPIFACQEDLDCALSNLPPDLVPFETQLRQIYLVPDEPGQVRGAIDAALALQREQPQQTTNLLIGVSCRVDHLAPLFFELWQQNKQLRAYWHWPNVWGPRCGNVWAAPDFEAFVEEVGLVDYWREAGWPAMCRPADDGVDCG